MSNKFKCSFCSSVVPVIKSTYRSIPVSSYLKSDRIPLGQNAYSSQSSDELEIFFYYCPNCEKTTVKALGKGSLYKNKTWNLFPDSSAKQLPNYIPSSIIEDYEEACKILHLSPKASATLSRRCLQGMIRDFWKINKNTLVEEINALDERVDSDTREVLHSLRQLGNIGAHPEKDINLIIDIDPDEAEQLVLFIEYLFDEWYIKQHERKSMLQRIKDINSEKKDLKKINH